MTYLPDRLAPRLFAIALTIGTLCAGPSRAAEEFDDAVREHLRNRIEAADIETAAGVATEPILTLPAIRRFYQVRSFAPAWVEETAFSSDAPELLAALQDAAHEGLRPADYHARAIDKLLADARAGHLMAPAAATDAELLLTDAFLLLASHYLTGKLDPRTINADWDAHRPEIDLAALLESALSRHRVAQALHDLLPASTEYSVLRDALRSYRQQAAQGGWEAVSTGPKLELGAIDARVAVLRRRLLASGDLPAGGSIAQAQYFDEALRDALARFQRRHGLDADGVVGARTLAELDVTAAERVRQIAVNMERLRWLPSDLGRRHVRVNIAAFDVVVVEDSHEVLAMDVIVGRSYRRTPVFSEQITYLVLNPSWEVPPSIAVRDKLPLIRKDPGYLAAHGFRVLRGWGADETEVDPASVDWSAVSRNSFPFRLRQRPGPQNALGRVKFMFPNSFNVYMHDTPDQQLFLRTERTFSSGCIRLSRPRELAALLLGPDSDWTRQRIDAVIASGRETTVRLPQPVPVHILYATAWVAADGSLQLRRDVYDRDVVVSTGLETPPPAHGAAKQRAAP
jgi:murein L,D-transpeptidase YcbB/YkuD